MFTNDSFPTVSFVSAYLSRKLGVISGVTCEFPKAELKAIRIPAPLANVSTVSNYSKDDRDMLSEIAAEIGMEISDLYESVDNEESDFRDMRETIAMSRISELSGMAGNIADDTRAKNAAAIAEWKDSAVYGIAVSLIDMFGCTKNAMVRINNARYVELFNVESDLGRGIDNAVLVGRIAPAKSGIDFMPVMDGQITMSVNYDSVTEFFESVNIDEIFPVRVNVIKSRHAKFRNMPKGAKGTAIADNTGNAGSDNADKATADKSRTAILAEAAKFGYFPLPSNQGESDISEEEKKTRASMKKRNQRAKKRAMEAMDEKRLEIMAMIDAITAKNVSSKSRAKAEKVTAAIVPVKSFDIVAHWESVKAEKEELAARNELAKIAADNAAFNAKLEARERASL